MSVREIKFTQYLRPDGQRVNVTIERPEEVAAKADAIVEAGFCFEVEELTTGQASLTIYDPRTQEDVAIRVVPNAPGVSEAVDDMILNFRIPDTEGA